jgi:hypothetical protein
MSDNANLNPQFRGQILETASTIETGSRVIASPSDLPILGTDTCLDIKLTVPQALAITLPSLAQLATVVGGRKLRILDANGSWGTCPVTLNASGADKIDGESSITLSQPWGGVEIESRGTYWHVSLSGVVGLGGMGGGFGPDLLPTPAAADDDEFNGTTLASSWQLFGAALQAGDPSRGATIVGPNMVRVSQTLRTGWLLFQPDATAGISKLLSTPMTQGAIYCKFSMDANDSVGPDAFSLALCQSALGNIDLDNAVSVTIQRATADYTWTVIAEKRVAGVSTTVYSKTLDSLVQPFDRIQINRNGGSFLFFIGSEAGGMKYLGTAAAAINPDRVAMLGNNTGGPSTIYGLDYIRRVDGVNPTV